MGFDDNLGIISVYNPFKAQEIKDRPEIRLQLAILDSRFGVFFYAFLAKLQYPVI